MTGPKSPTLADLIRDYRERTGDSYERIGNRAGLLRGHVYKLEKSEMKQMPTQETLQKLAAGLMLPVAIVNEAALASVGGETRSSGALSARPVQLDTLHAIASGLSEEDQHLLVGIAGMLATRRAQDRA